MQQCFCDHRSAADELLWLLRSHRSIRVPHFGVLSRVFLSSITNRGRLIGFVRNRCLCNPQHLSEMAPQTAPRSVSRPLRVDVSEAWNYFSKLDNLRIQCDLCGCGIVRSVVGRHSTEALWAHLARWHSDAVEQLGDCSDEVCECKTVVIS